MGSVKRCLTWLDKDTKLSFTLYGGDWIVCIFSTSRLCSIYFGGVMFCLSFQSFCSVIGLLKVEVWATLNPRDGGG